MVSVDVKHRVYLLTCLNYCCGVCFNADTSNSAHNAMNYYWRVVLILCRRPNFFLISRGHVKSTNKGVNSRFPEITGEGNLTVFSYSGRVKSPEWRWQRRRADLRHFEIFGHGPIIIYTRLPAGVNLLPDLHVPLEQWVFDRHFWCLLCRLFTDIRHLPHVLTVPPTKACLLCATPARMDLYTQVHARSALSPLDFRR